jgi:lipopolysaccharide export system protein LptA
MTRRTALIFIFLFSFILPATAQENLPTGSDAPIEISAAKSLEWNRQTQTYTAHKDAHGKQGDFEIFSDTLTAHYTDDKGATSIQKLSAAGNVTIKSPPYTASGEYASYEVDKKYALLTGKDLKIVTPTESLTARDKIEFFGTENRLHAAGGATAVRGTDTLTADNMNAYFQKDTAGEMALQKMTADGNVVIRTSRETVYGDKGVYDIASQKAVLTGKVRILQGENWLEGTRADIDLKTGISQLFAKDNAATEGRVKGVFYPKKNGDKTNGATQ